MHWIAALQRDPPDVLIGSNFAEYGGVREHIHAIQRYTSLRAELAPGDELLESISPHEVKTLYRDEFMNFSPGAGMRAVHSHVFPWFIEWAGRVARPGLVWVHTYHAPYVPDSPSGGLEPWQIEFNNASIDQARHADVRLSVSRWQTEWLRDAHGIDASYLPNGVDVAACERGNAELGRRTFGEEPFVLFVGRNDPVKNPAEFAMLAHCVPSQRFVMIGRDLSADVLRSVWGVETPPNLLLAGEATHAQVQHALAACCALVVTSKREGLPTVVLEAMAHGKPVVVPDERGCVEAINHGECGHVYAPGELEDLAAKLSLALGADSRVGASRQRILSHYDWNVVARELDDIYRGASPRNSGPGTPQKS